MTGLKINIVSVELKDRYHLCFECYMPFQSRSEFFTYTGTDITGCVFHGSPFYNALIDRLNDDFGWPYFNSDTINKEFPIIYDV